MFLSNTWEFLVFLTIVQNVFCIDSFQYHEPEIFSLNTKHRTGTNRHTDVDFSELVGIDQKEVLRQHTFSNIQKEKVEVLSKLLKVHVDQLRDVSDEVELVFLVDASASVGLENFQSELNFVRKLLSDFTVAPDSTRVAVVTFGGKTSIIRHIDQISNPDVSNHKCRLLNQQLGSITYSGGGTYTRGALLEAHNILERSRSGARKAVFLITDGFSNGGDPRPAATSLKDTGVVVFTFGIRTGNIEELHHIASESGYTHLLDSFQEFEALARRALHHDLKAGQYVHTKSSQECDSLCSKNSSTDNNAAQCCDDNASCACGIVTGHYACLCHPGYFGSGLNGFCQPCPNGTFGLGIIPGDSNAACIPCPDLNHVTVKKPATSIGDCICAAGFKAEGTKCVALTCPKLQVPENGYLVKANACNNVLNAACGIRCQIGFHLTGDSIRLCLKSGAWSGTAPQCLLKTCPALLAPSNGNIHCEHEDERQVINTRLSAFPIDTHCEYKCDPGYQLRGSRSRNCLPLSRWDGLKVSCRSIKCQPLKSVQNGEIIPESCTTSNKIYFGTKCVVRCKEGFTREGPEKRICSGHTGTWSHRHSVTQCIDTTPPTITCPNNITVETLPGKNHAIANWQDAVAADNAETPPTVWSEPFVTDSSKMGIGIHVIIYNAQDANKNTAQCYFGVTVIDKEPPTVENCVDPPAFLLQSDEAATNISWDEPVFYDNSGLPIEISRSHVPGEHAFGLGVTKIVYVATDQSNNTRTCVLNVTVEDACEKLSSLENGYSVCAKLQDGIQCVVTCAEGYAFALPESVLQSNDENLTLTCNKGHHSWNEDVFPDCSVTQVPYAIAQDLTVSFNGNTSHCEDPVSLDAISRNIKTGLESRLLEICTDGMECNVLQSDPVCKDEKSNVRRPRRYSNGIRKKRKAQKERKKNGGQKWDKTEVKYKIIGKIIDNHRNNPKKGMTKLKERLEKMVKNGRLNLLDDKTKQELGKLEIRLDMIFQEPNELCYNGSILKRNSCVKCPLGTFHNVTRNQCQSCPFQEYQDEFGSIHCKKCPAYTSTRKMHSKSPGDCINVCRPGYYSRRKRHHKAPLALAPCVTCGIGFYQPKYAQLKCIPCPTNTTTVTRGAKFIDECFQLGELDKDPCDKNPCLNGGNCTVVDNNFSCRCIGNFIGSRCEILPNPCDSSPCLNEGQCILSNSSYPSERKCLCKNGYTGVNCEVYIDECSTSPCQNNGTCISTEEDFECICQDGFEGEVCEIEIDHCMMSPCESNSMCSSINATWQCACKPGFIGRRCSRLPCDWLPCHANAICINIEEFNATKNSYRCECPEGYTGQDCTTRINHCQDSPCMNNGTCLNNLLEYTCECPNGFNGSNCENELSSSYIMNFPKSGTTDYVMIKGPNRNLIEFTICLWLQSVDTFNYGTVVSYATYLYDNALTLTDYNGFVIYVNGNRVVTDITVNDGFWHFVCISWESLSGSWNIYVDGIIRENGTLLANGTQIEGNGILVIGQEQDVLGGGFSESESLLGKLSLLDIWDEVLDDEVIRILGTQCEPYHGSLYSWAQLQGHIRGNVEIQNSSFCKACPLPTAPSRGSIEVNEDGSEIVYTCEKGYLVKFGKNESPKLRRMCLKQAEWKGYYTPTCAMVRCGFPGYFPRGRLHGKSYTYGDRIRYSCTQGYRLRGNPQRICTADGTWSGIQPLCIGTTCKNLLAPNNGDIEYVVEEYERDDTSILQVGQQLEFKCAPGFRLLGSLLLTCLQNGSWDNPVPQCIAFGCPPPELIDNGYIASNVSTGVEMLPHMLASSQIDSSSARDTDLPDSGYLYGDIVGFSCHPGYKFRGNRNLITEFRMQCTENGTWIGTVPDCVPLHCSRPEAVKNSRTYLLSGNNMTEIPKSETFGNLTFINKLVPISNKQLPTFDGPFDIPLSTDELNVSNLTTNLTKHADTMLEEFQAEFNVSFILGSQISTVCNKGYKLVGAPVRNCTINETWSPEALSCERQECDMAEHPLIKMLTEKKDDINIMSKELKSGDVMKNLKRNTQLNGTLKQFAFAINGSFFGDVISLTCLNGTKIDFKDIGVAKVLENVTWVCNEHGKWETIGEKTSVEEVQRMLAKKKEDFCQLATCSSPKVPTNGYIASDGTNNSPKTAGDLVTYKCRQGYRIMNGRESAKCLLNGTWSSVPNCEPIECGKPPTPLNTVLDDSSAEAAGYVFGNMVSYWCVPGYKMYGRGSARCSASGKWLTMNGRCSRISCGKPAVPPGVKTMGPSLLFEAYLTYICPDKTVKGRIRCNSDGKWSQFPDCGM